MYLLLATMAHGVLAWQGLELGLDPRKRGSIGRWLTGELELVRRWWSTARSDGDRGGLA
jgi:hypothetical protein